jgi:hypothetical protein
MTERMLNADALGKLLDWVRDNAEDISIYDTDSSSEMIELTELRQKINELATPAPEPQGNIIELLKQQIEIEKRDCPIDGQFKRGWVTALMNIEQHIEVLTQEPTGGNE